MKIVESNSHLTDLPTTYDFMPTTMYQETKNHTLEYTPGEDPLKVWTCFNPFVLGETADRKHYIFFQWGFLFPDKDRVEGPASIMLDGDLYGVTFKAPVYYDAEKRLYPHPTIYIYGEKDGVKYVESLSFNEADREWIITIKPVGSEEGIVFESRAKCRGIPMWFGKPDGPYTLFGFYPSVKDVDFWSSCWDSGVCKGKFMVPGVGTYSFSGPFVNVRSIHFAYYGSKEALGWRPTFPAGGQYGFIQQDNLTINFGYCPNILPDEFPEFKPLRSGLVSLHNKKKYMAFDNFDYSDSGGPRPSKFYLSGEYKGVEVDLTGESFMYFPKEDKLWTISTEPWWEKGTKRNFAWGRNWIRWNGKVTLDREMIEVKNAMGAMEHCGRLEGCPPWSK